MWCILSSTSSFAVANNDAAPQSSDAINHDAPSEPEFLQKEITVGGDVFTDVLTQGDLETISHQEYLLFREMYRDGRLAELREALATEARRLEFEKSLKVKFALDGSEIRTIRKLENEDARAKNAPLHNVKLVINTIQVESDSPQPIIIRVAKGYSSSLLFFDEQGNPWDIEGDVIGDGSAFTSNKIPTKKHVALFEIKRAFSQTNALITLSGLPTPVVVRLVGDDRTVDARLSVRIPELGNNADRSYTYSSNRAVSSAIVSDDMLTVLNGSHLVNGKKFNLNGVKGDVWFKNNFLYIRTKAELKLPHYLETLSSPTGINVYQIHPRTSLLFTQDGELLSAVVEERGYQAVLVEKESLFK